MGETLRRPVTLTMREGTVGLEGWASRVVTLCSTFWNGRVWEGEMARVRGWTGIGEKGREGAR